MCGRLPTPRSSPVPWVVLHASGRCCLAAWMIVLLSSTARGQSPGPAPQKPAVDSTALKVPSATAGFAVAAQDQAKREVQIDPRLYELFAQDEQPPSSYFDSFQDDSPAATDPTTYSSEPSYRDGVSQPSDYEPWVPDYQDGVFSPYAPIPPYRDLYASFGPGFQLQTADRVFRLQIHYESQVESRVWTQSDQVLSNSGVDGIYLPRQRIFFNGNITEPIEYEFSINRGVNNLNLLNAYINLHFDDRFELRFGRFFTPLPYDQYAISNYWLPTPERSLFTTNVGLNRQFGIMAWGYLADDRLDYAIGIFNGSRNSFENTDNAMDGVGYLNLRPFQNRKQGSFLRFLNIGSSVAFGRQDQSPVPVAFRIGGGSPDTNIPGSATVPFLVLNPDVIEHGDRLLGSVHAAHFYKGLSLIGEWQYGYGDYASTANPAATRVPFAGFYVTAGYFLTGEEVERRARVKPLRPFVPLRKGTVRGPGAWEVVTRVSELQLGEEVFTSGFADAAVWNNRAITTEVGTNWYWNDYTKIYMFWLHGDFSNTPSTPTSSIAKTADMFWLRFQLYF